MRAVLENKEAKNSTIASDINACMSKFSAEDLAILEQIILKNTENGLAFWTNVDAGQLQASRYNFNNSAQGMNSKKLGRLLIV